MKNSCRTILLVEDDPAEARRLRAMLKEEGSRDLELTHVGCLCEAEAWLAGQGLAGQLVDIILLDLGLPDAHGLEAVRRGHAAAPQTPLVVLTDLDDEALGAQALREGAQDHLVKRQITTPRLGQTLRYAIERKAMEEALVVQMERAQATLNCIGDAIICTDIAGNITFINAVGEKLTGWSRQEAIGRPIAEIFRILDATSRDVTPNRMEMAVAQDRTVYLPTNCVLIARDGCEIAIDDSASPIHDRHGVTTGAVIVFRDVSAARTMAREMAHSAEHDFLTGLPNRLLLNDRIGQAIALAPRRQNKVAVLFLDLDGFKHINDSLGHPVGDKLLQSIAKRLIDCVRDADTVSRQGGDEFVVLLSDAKQRKDAATTAKRILRMVAKPHCVDRRDLHVTASIGVSLYPDDGLDAATLIKNADIAMYHAKANGRRNYQFFTPAMNIRAVEQQTIKEGLQRALERREFALHYQPKIDLHSGAITGAEALLRWTHPRLGAISPARFIPVAEDCGLILPIGAWVFQEAGEQARAWAAAGLPPTTIALNVSALEFYDANFAANLCALLDRTGLAPRSVEIELTERVLMRHSESAAVILRTLRDSGMQVALDDFGTGYSSLGYLRKFPVDTLKIDRSLVRQIGTAGDDTAIVTAVISMAHSLNLRVVAEGVETPEEAAFLRARQCDEAQGYYFSRPLPAEQFTKLLATGIPATGGLRRIRQVSSVSTAIRSGYPAADNVGQPMLIK
ncbi:MAG TPA: EAL domain-containing protein [Stellaceae bacterium]|nr:EAL domain-containing protein [Stellaceae bacterium]